MLQQPNQHQANVTNSPHPQLLQPLPPQPQAPHDGGGSNRPSLMEDGGQQAKITPQDQVALKCPRCESTNTKFCYFNNYSLSQPRHFCKTCRRYWTRGGSLRNVPVGGGFRRNKKNKRRSRSKSPASTDNKHSLSNSTSANPSSGISITPDLIGRFPPHMASSLQNLSCYGMGNMSTNHMGFQIGDHSSLTAVGGVDQWRLQQFPFLNGFESTSSAVSYPFQSESVEAPYGLVGDVAGTPRVTHELPPAAKLEDLNLSRSPLSVSVNNQYYSWNNLSGPSSSSASRLL